MGTKLILHSPTQYLWTANCFYSIVFIHSLFTFFKYNLKRRHCLTRTKNNNLWNIAWKSGWPDYTKDPKEANDCCLIHVNTQPISGWYPSGSCWNSVTLQCTGQVNCINLANVQLQKPNFF